jgi:hypothetical protein
MQKTLDSTDYPLNSTVPLLWSEKGLEFRVGLVWRFFREEVTAVKGAAADVVRPVPPHGKHVIPRLPRALSAPQRADGAWQASPASVGLVVLVVQRGRGSVLLAARVARLGARTVRAYSARTSAGKGSALPDQPSNM